MFVKLENNVPTQWPVSEYQVRLQFTNKSLPEYINENVAKELGYGVFVFNGYPSTYDPIYQNIEEITPVLENGKYQQSYKITEKYTPEEKKAKQDEQAKAKNKQQAEMLLQATDWTENNSVRNTSKNPHLVNGDDFDNYRVALRSIAVNPPVVVENWPTKPDEAWSS